MDSKAKPGDEARLNPGQWGCWRSHANFWQKVLNERIETALILEDDLDWDPNLHDIMEQLGNNMRKNTLRATGMSTYEKENAPYGRSNPILRRHSNDAQKQANVFLLTLIQASTGTSYTLASAGMAGSPRSVIIYTKILTLQVGAT